MDIDEAKELKRKAIEVLEKFDTPHCLNWMMWHSPWLTLDINPPTGKKSISKLQSYEQFKCFESEGDWYELYFWRESKGFNGFIDPSKSTYYLYVNEQLVLETLSDNAQLVRLLERNVKVIQLSDWVEKLPKIVELEKAKALEKEDEEQGQKDSEEAERISKNFDLGKYE